jgi:hypothetical protein
MKKSMREGVGMANKKAEKEAITDEEEEKFWVGAMGDN